MQQNKIMEYIKILENTEIFAGIASHDIAAMLGCLNTHQRDNHIFTIPFDRSAMAEYLNVERSALSRELSQMKKDGLIDFYKNKFRLF